MYRIFRLGMRIAVACVLCALVVILLNQWWLAYERSVAVKRQKSTAPNGETRMVKVVDGVEYAFRWCPPGKFKMGRMFGRNLESPRHTVTLTNGFWMLETEVTQAMWKSVMGENPSDFKGDNLPVLGLSSGDCWRFLKKLSPKIGMVILLPTEAQWEYACRAGTTGPFAGDLDATDWYKGNSGGTLHPVGQKKPNTWGLYDMRGNIAEWCFDRGGYYPRGSVTDPVESEEPLLPAHIYRGGSGDDEARDCTPTIRHCCSPDPPFFGFRFVALIDAEVARLAEKDKQLREEEEREQQKREAQAAQVQKETAPNGETRLVKTVDGVEYAFRWCPPGNYQKLRDVPLYVDDPYEEEDATKPDEESKPAEKSRPDSDKSQQQEPLSSGFWMLETEVTQAMWQSVMGENPSLFRSLDRPVEQVSWNDCQEFCRRLSDKIGMTISLPTEAQWLYACRAGIKGPRIVRIRTSEHWEYVSLAGIDSPEPYYGDLAVKGWYKDNADKMTHPVGQKPANAWGLYDMYGNVEEWCQDYEDPNDAVADSTNSASSAMHIIRGDDWCTSINYHHRWFRTWDWANHWKNSRGFRVVGLAP